MPIYVDRYDESEVDAKQFRATPDNLVDVEAWAKGAKIAVKAEGKSLRVGKAESAKTAERGDWIVKAKGMTVVLRSEAFEERYRPGQTRPAA